MPKTPISFQQGAHLLGSFAMPLVGAGAGVFSSLPFSSKEDRTENAFIGAGVGGLVGGLTGARAALKWKGKLKNVIWDKKIREELGESSLKEVFDKANKSQKRIDPLKAKLKEAIKEGDLDLKLKKFYTEPYAEEYMKSKGLVKLPSGDIKNILDLSSREVDSIVRNHPVLRKHYEKIDMPQFLQSDMIKGIARRSLAPTMASVGVTTAALKTKTGKDLKERIKKYVKAKRTSK